MSQNHALSIMTDKEAEIVALSLARIDHATDIAELAKTNVVIPADTMRDVLNFVELLVKFYNEATEC